MTVLELDIPINVEVDRAQLDRDFGQPKEPEEVKDAREALYDKLTGIFDPDEIVGKRILPTQTPGVMLVIQSRAAKQLRVGPRAMTVSLIEGDNTLILASINAARARSHNLARMDAQSLQAVSRIVQDAEEVIKQSGAQLS